MAGQRRQQRGEQGRRLGRARPAGRGAAAPRRGRRAAGRGRAGCRARRPAGRARGRCRASARSCRRSQSRSPASPSNKATRSSRASIRGAVEQGRAEIGGEQPRAGAGDGAVDRGEQAAGARAGGRDGQLQALARRRVDHHMIARGAARPAAAGRAASRARPRRDRRAGRPPRTRRRGRTGRSRRASRPRTAPSAGARPRGCRSRPCGSRPRRRRSGSGAIISAAPSRASSASSAPGGDRGQLEPAGRDVGGGEAVALADLGHRDQPVGGARIEQGLLGQRAGGDDPDDGAVDHRLGAALLRLGRAFDLLGDGDAVAGP